MLTWLSANWGTLLVLFLVVALVTVIITGMKKERKQGKTSCSHGCSNCAMHGQCHAGARAK